MLGIFCCVCLYARKSRLTNGSIGHLIGSVNCHVIGQLWRHQKAVSFLGWDKSISDTRRLSRTPRWRMSRNKRRNLWIGWCVSYWRPWFGAVCPICYHIHTLYQSCSLSDQNKFFLRDMYIPKLQWPWWCVGWYDTGIIFCLVSNEYSNCIVPDSRYQYIDKGTMWYCAFRCALF